MIRPSLRPTPISSRNASDSWDDTPSQPAPGPRLAWTRPPWQAARKPCPQGPKRGVPAGPSRGASSGQSKALVGRVIDPSFPIEPKWLHGGTLDAHCPTMPRFLRFVAPVEHFSLRLVTYQRRPVFALPCCVCRRRRRRTPDFTGLDATTME